MAMRLQDKRGITKRVRFVWCIKDAEDIAWLAPGLRRVAEMVSQEAATFDIFATGERRSSHTEPHQERLEKEVAAPASREVNSSSSGSVEDYVTIHHNG